ncbi:MAG: hypothetical protein AB1428_14465 [Bacteroidota bacterium]
MNTRRLPCVTLLFAVVVGAGVAGSAETQGGKRQGGDSIAIADQRPGSKNPELAGAISILAPGMGHVYAGETVKGLVLTGLFVAGIGGVAAADIGQTHDSIKPAGWISVGFVAAVYFYSLIDSPFAAERENARVGGGQLMEFNVGGAMVSLDIATQPHGPCAIVCINF